MSFNSSSQTPSGFQALGDELTLSGTDGTEFVLEMDVSAADLLAAFGSVPAAGAAAPPLDIQWADGSGWEDAVYGNSAGTRTAYAGETYATFLSQHGGTLLPSMLGSEGFYYDGTNAQVWGILDHNSAFNVGTTAVPEPATISLLLLPAILLLRRRK